MEEITHDEQSDAYREQIRKRIKRQQAFPQYLSIWFGVSVILTIVWFLTKQGLAQILTRRLPLGEAKTGDQTPNSRSEGQTGTGRFRQAQPHIQISIRRAFGTRHGPSLARRLGRILDQGLTNAPGARFFAQRPAL